MMDIQSIRDAATTAFERAERAMIAPKRIPDDWHSLTRAEQIRILEFNGGIPFTGGYCNPHFEATDRDLLFVDLSGMGAEDEPALTMHQLLEALTPGHAYALVEHGQFQGHLAEYRPKS